MLVHLNIVDHEDFFNSLLDFKPVMANQEKKLCIVIFYGLSQHIIMSLLLQIAK